MEHNNPYTESFHAPQSSSHMIQGSTGFGIHGGQFTNVQGNVIHTVVPYPTNTGIILPRLQNTSQMMVPNTSSQTIDDSESGNYRSQLLRRGRGFPLYIPGPQVNLPAEYRRRGVGIGDVGRVTPEGDFEFFFNIYRPADHPINARVPDDFVPLSPYCPDDIARHDFDPGNYVSSPSVTDINNGFSEFPGAEFGFNCVGPNGAVLALPYGAHLKKLRNLESMRRYAAKHAESWYKYVNGERGRGLVNGSLYLVTGCEKAQSWGMASFQDISIQTEFQLSFRPTTDADSGYRYRWQGTRSHRKQADSPPDGAPLNQTTFIHAFAISVCERIWEKLFGVEVCQPVDSSTFPDKSGRNFVPFGSQGSSFGWSFFLGSSRYNGGKQSADQASALDGMVNDAFPVPQMVHPSQIIHERIFYEVPQARVVITHDDDWRDVFKNDGIQTTEQNFSELQQAIFDRSQIIEEDGAVFLMANSDAESHTTVSTNIVTAEEHRAYGSITTNDQSSLPNNNESLALHAAEGSLPLMPHGMDPTDYRAFYPSTANEVKHRKRTSSAQLKVLEGVFKRDTKPNSVLRAELASQLNMTARGVQVWFQNRRAKERTKAAKGKASSEDGDSPSPRSSEAPSPCSSEAPSSCSSEDPDELSPNELPLPRLSTSGSRVGRF
ncbi:hypothetical protein K438DRAFT_72601 [Mycena galopus ATCC 62051]|nr:hypothetical protein K438DRAFT_72601 [Mycena galopus ATCC 62051]